MKNYGLLSITLLISYLTNAQSWQILQRTHNNLIPLSTRELQQDTLRLFPGKSYEIDLPGLFDQNTGKLKKKLYVQDLADAQYLDIEISHERSIVDLNDTLYIAKVRLQHKAPDMPIKLNRPARLVVRDQNGRREKELVLMPNLVVATTAARD